MEAEVLNALRDPAGLPTHPLVFLVLGVLTFALHIAAVQLMLGATGLTLWGSLSKDAHKRQLASTMLGVGKVMLSVAIVIGVAPLLFVQVIYDPFWYASNVLSAWWVIGFILILSVGYVLMYVYYWMNGNLHYPKQSVKCPGSLLVSVALLLVVGFIMHVLTNQMLTPDLWMQWYAPEGKLDTSGTQLHSFNLWRFAFFISLSVPVTGAFLIAMRRYFRVRADADHAYLDWVGALGMKWITFGGVASLIVGALWLMGLEGKQAEFVASPWVMVSVAALLGFVAYANWVWNGKRDTMHSYMVMPVGAVALIVVAASREALRWSVLVGQFGFDVMGYPVNMDWYSTILFFVTFAVLGGGVLGYLLTVAWQAGQTVGQYTPSGVVVKMGNIALTLLILWVVQFFAVGFYVWMQ
jgi:hypothetical protein